jgi:hypothetical protein
LMRSNKQWEEISAYLDGEAKSPEKVQAWLAKDDALAKRLAALRATSERMREWPESAPRPGFAKRVMANLETAPAEAAPAWRLALRAHAALAAAVLIGIVSFSLYAPETTAPVNTVPALNVSLVEEEQALVAQLAQRLSETPGDVRLAAQGFYMPRRPAEVYDAQLLTLFADTDVTMAWTGDYSTPITQLDDAGRTAFRDVLSATIQRETAGGEI